MANHLTPSITSVLVRCFHAKGILSVIFTKNLGIKKAPVKRGFFCRVHNPIYRTVTGLTPINRLSTKIVEPFGDPLRMVILVDLTFLGEKNEEVSK